MKKFLSICLVALCSVSAMYAQTGQTTPTPSTDQRTGVACGTEVTVEATSKTGFYHFVEWQIQNGSTILETLSPNGTAADGNNDYGASVSTAILTDGTGKDKSTLTLNSLSNALIDAATSGTVTFEAFFEIDSYNIEVTADGNGTVSGGGPATGDTQFTLTANPGDNCTKVDYWLDETGARVNVDPNNPNQLTVTPKATWENGETYRFKAVFVTKTVNITVTTADSNKGTVQILAPANN